MTLGQALKEARQRREWSLRDVERQSNISNGYLSQLESDSVRNPSPRHLHELAELYGVSYGLFMELAGYAVPTRVTVPPPEQGLDALTDLSTTELAQVRAFVGFLRSSRPDKKLDS